MGSNHDANDMITTGYLNTFYPQYAYEMRYKNNKNKTILTIHIMDIIILVGFDIFHAYNFGER
jgi:hypothetical protein